MAPMDNKQIVENLNSLVQLDIDAIHAYDQAIESIDLKEVRDQLTLFRDDHQRHVDDLTPFISTLGGQPPEFKKDFKGYLIEGMTAVRGTTGTSGALKAMKQNEGLTNTKYEKALSWDLPSDIRQVIVRNREDERRHIDYISRCIDEKVWEKKTAAA